MPVQISCPSCQTKLAVADHTPKVRCPQCLQVLAATQPTNAKPTNAKAVAPQHQHQHQHQASALRTTSSLVSLLPASSLVSLLPTLPVIVGLTALVLPFLFFQPIVCITVASLSVALGSAGLALAFMKRISPGGYLAGLALGVAALLFSIQFAVLKSGVEANQRTLAAKTQALEEALHAESEAKKELADAKAKLEKGNVAPKGGLEKVPGLDEELRKKAEEAQAKAEAAERRAADLLHKAQETEKANELARAQLDVERKKNEQDLKKATEAARKEMPAEKAKVEPETCKEVFELLKSKGMKIDMAPKRQTILAKNLPAIWVLDRDGSGHRWMFGSGSEAFYTAWPFVNGWAIVTQHPTEKDAKEAAGTKTNAYHKGRFCIEGDEPLLSEIKKRF